MAPHAALAEIGVPYELVRVERNDAGESPPAYLALNPSGRVPTLEDGDLVLTETAAILLHLADRYPDGPAHPPVRLDRALGVLPVADLGDEHAPDRDRSAFSTPSATAHEGVSEAARAELETLFDRLDAHLATRDWVAGPERSIADLFISMVTRWGRHLDPPAWERPNLRAHWLRCFELEGVRTMFVEQDLELPAFAQQLGRLVDRGPGRARRRIRVRGRHPDLVAHGAHGRPVLGADLGHARRAGHRDPPRPRRGIRRRPQSHRSRVARDRRDGQRRRAAPVVRGAADGAGRGSSLRSSPPRERSRRCSRFLRVRASRSAWRSGSRWSPLGSSSHRWGLRCEVTSHGRLRTPVLSAGAALCFGVSLYAAGSVSGTLSIGLALLPARLIGVVAVGLPLVAMRRVRLTRRAAPLLVLGGVLRGARPERIHHRCPPRPRGERRAVGAVRRSRGVGRVPHLR